MLFKENRNAGYKSAGAIINELKNSIGYNVYDKRQLISKNLRPIAHPFYREYEEVRKICLMILRNKGVGLFGGDSNETKGILCYIPDLWEDFLEKKIQEKINYRMEAQYEICVLDEKLSTRPDFVFFNNENTPFAVLDAKFKKDLENYLNDRKLPPVSLDDYTKCIRDMVSIDSKFTGVISPVNDKTKEKGNNEIHSISKYNKNKSFYIFPVFIPSPDDSKGNDSYEKWLDNFEHSVTEAMDQIFQSLQYEYNRRFNPQRT